jgi:hypothetical protein
MTQRELKVNRPAKIWLGGTALALLGAIAVAHPGHPPIPTPTITVEPNPQPVPFELFRGNRIVVAAQINGHETRVMLDTGASMSTLNRSYARSIGLPEGFKIQAKGAGGPVDAELVSGLTLELGGFHAQNASVGVMDLAPVERDLGMPISAIFGRDFFNSAVVSIDWAKNRLSVQSHETFRPEAAANALELTKRGPFNTIKVSIAGAPPIDALLDLGNGNPLILPRTYWGGRPELTGLRSAAAVVGGVGGMHSARAALVPEITLAGATFNAVPAILSESGSDEDPTQMANVGIGLLKQFKVDLDLGRDRIYLTPRKDSPPFGRDRAGVRFDLAGDRLKATFVSPDGPAAAAGLTQGDEVTAVDGHPVTNKYYEAADWTRAAAGRKVVLTRADGSKVTVALADYY